MPNALTALDRLRIGRAVLSIAASLQDLPAKRRRDIIRELRANLRASAADVGVNEAIRRLGPARRVASNYLEAEYGEDRPHPHWLSGVAWAVGVAILLLVLGIVGHMAFVDGILTVSPDADGRYTWDGLRPWGPESQVTLADGKTDTATLRWPLIPTLIGLCLAYGLGGRLWRALPWRRSRPAAAESVS